MSVHLNPSSLFRNQVHLHAVRRLVALAPPFHDVLSYMPEPTDPEIEERRRLLAQVCFEIDVSRRILKGAYEDPLGPFTLLPGEKPDHMHQVADQVVIIRDVLDAAARSKSTAKREEYGDLFVTHKLRLGDLLGQPDLLTSSPVGLRAYLRKHKR